MRGIVLVAFLLATLVVVSIWLGKVSSDLNWDEAHSYRVYARHPLAAVALYLEPNNHPLESLYRSLFWTVGGVSKSSFYRLPGLSLVAGFLIALTWALWPWVRARAWTAAAIFLFGVITAAETQVQALQLRGYFPSMLLVVLLVGRLLRRMERSPTPRALAIDSLLVALLLFTVPSNLLLLPALAAGFWLAEPVGGPGEKWRRTATRALLTAGLTCLFYAPIGIGVLLGVNRLDRFPSAEHPGFATGFVTGLRDAFAQSAPAGVGWEAFAAAAVGVLALAVVFDRGARETRLAWGWWALSLATLAVFSAFITAPVRIKSPFVVILWAGLAVAVAGLTRSRPERVRRTLALAIVGAILFLLPALRLANRPRFTVSHIVTLALAQGDPQRQQFLLGADTADLGFAFSRTFGENHVILGAHHIEEAFRGSFESPVPEDAGWKTTLRRRFFPELERPPIQPDSVDVLVLAREADFHPDSTLWNHPLLDSIRARLPHAETAHIPPYYLDIWRR